MKMWNMFKVNNKDNDAVLVFLLLTLIIFHTFSFVSFGDFEQVNASLMKWFVKSLGLNKLLNPICHCFALFQQPLYGSK